MILVNTFKLFYIFILFFKANRFRVLKQKQSEDMNILELMNYIYGKD